MPVSESEKLGGVSVVGVGEKGEPHIIPIKKRRIIIRRSSSPPSPTCNLSLGAAERQSPEAASYCHGVLFNPNANSTVSVEEAVSGIAGSNDDDDDDDEKKLALVKDDGISILAACSSNNLGAQVDHSGTVSSVVTTTTTKTDEISSTAYVNEQQELKIIIKQEEPPPDSTTPSKVVVDDESTTCNNSELPLASFTTSKTNQDPNKSPPVRDAARFSWDLNTVMLDAASEEPPFVKNEPQVDVANDNETLFLEKERKNDFYTSASTTSQNIISSQNFLKSHLAHDENEELKKKLGGKCQPFSVAVKTESIDAIPVTRTNLTVPVKTESTNINLTLHSSSSSKDNVGFSSTIPHSTATTATVMPKHHLSSENGPLWRREVTTFNEVAMTKMELTSTNVENMVIKQEAADKEPVDQITFGYANLQNDNRAGYGVDKQEVGYDSQYEDGELRESSTHAWKGCELKNNEEYKYHMENRENDLNLRVVVDAPRETSYQNGQGGSSSKVTEAGFGKQVDLTSSLVLPQKLNSSDEILSGLVPNAKSNGQENRETQVQNANRSEWKINVSGCDILPENQQISSNNFTKTRNLTGRKFFYGEPKDRFETGDVEMRAEGSKFCRKESLTRIAGPSTHDEYVSRDRFRMQGCSSKADDGFTSRPERELDGLRSFGRGRYSPHHLSSGRGVGMWNRSPERGRDPKRLPSPSYQGPSFVRSMLDDSRTVDNMTNEGGMDSSRHGRSNTSSYVTRLPFRSRSPLNREAQDFRARLGLRPSEDTGHDRFVNLGRGRGQGRSMRYGTSLDDEGPRGRYHGPANDECDEYLTEYPRPLPRRRRCFSPIERRGNTSTYQHHQSNSRSPLRPRTRSPIGNTGFRRRSRSPDFRHDTRIWRPKSPNCRDHANEYNSGPRNNNSSPMGSRWVNYKERPVFDRRSPPPGRTNAPQGERFSFYDSRKKQNEYYRSGHPGHFSDLKESGRGRPRYVGNDSDRPDNGYRRGGFVRRYNMDTPTKRFHFDEDELDRGFDASDQHALELLARENLNSNMLGKHIF